MGSMVQADLQIEKINFMGGVYVISPCPYKIYPVISIFNYI